MLPRLFPLLVRQKRGTEAESKGVLCGPPQNCPFEAHPQKAKLSARSRGFALLDRSGEPLLRGHQFQRRLFCCCTLLPMKMALAVALLFGSSWTFAQSSRDYSKEIYKAGGLDRMADSYVCFDDDPKLDTFFIVAKSETLKQFLISTGDFKKCQKRNRRNSIGVS